MLIKDTIKINPVTKSYFTYYHQCEPIFRYFEFDMKLTPQEISDRIKNNIDYFEEIPF
jgi:hypothetical protein